MTNPTDKPREWWIAWSDNFDPNNPLGRVNNVLRLVCNFEFSNSVHVIEYSTYEKLRKASEKLANVLEVMAIEIPEYINQSEMEIAFREAACTALSEYRKLYPKDSSTHK